VENLQRMLLPYSAEEPIFFGFRMNPILKQGYMSENAGEKHFMVQKIKPSLNNCYRNCDEPWGAQGTRPECF
jgi:hypothetical protein